MKEKSFNFRTVLNHPLTPLFFILLLFVVLYSSSLSYPFLNYDDDVYVRENPLVKDFDISKLKLIFSTENLSNFSPMVTLSFALEHKLWGMNPAGYRSVSFLLHMGSIVLLYLLLLRLFPDKTLVTWVVLLFAVHPQRIEALVWISSRKDTLFVFFLLLSLFLYLQYLRRKTRGVYLFSLLSLSIALLAKVTAVIALPLFLLIDWWERRKFGRDLIVDKLPFALVALFLGLTNTSLLLTSNYNTGLGWEQFPRIAAGTLSFLVVRFFWPFRLALPYPLAITELNESFWLCLLIAILFFLVTGWLSSWNRTWFLGVSITMVTLFPVWMFMMRNYPMADRFTYLPSIGICLLTVAAVRKMAGFRVRRRLGFVVMAVLSLVMLTVLVTAHWRYLPAWRDNKIFWTDIIDKYPQSYEAYSKRAILLRHEGKLEMAKRDYDRAIELRPDYAGALWNRGIILGQLGQVEMAEKDFYNAALSSPDFFPRLVDLVRRGMLKNGNDIVLQAGEKLEERGMVSGPPFFYIMAYFYAKGEKWMKAERYIEAALKEEPDNGRYLKLKAQILKKAFIQ